MTLNWPSRCCALLANTLCIGVRHASSTRDALAWTVILCLVGCAWCMTGLAAILQEIGVLQKVSYDRNIVQYYGACLTAEQPMLIMEFCAVRRCRSTVMGKQDVAGRMIMPGILASPAPVGLLPSVVVAAEELQIIACTAGRRSETCTELG